MKFLIDIKIVAYFACVVGCFVAYGEHNMFIYCLLYGLQGEPKNVPTRKLRYLRNERIFFVPNFANLLTRQLRTSLLLCAVST